MKVSRCRIFARGLANSCPNCGERTLFRKGKVFQMNSSCSHCGFNWEGDSNEGHYLRATSLNFGITLVGFLIPVLLAFWQGWVSELTAEILAGTGAIVVPVLLYRGTRSWGLMNYYIFFPEELPANGGENPAGRESVDHHVEN